MSTSDPQSNTASGGNDLAGWHPGRVSQARHDLRSPTSEVLGFTVMAVSKLDKDHPLVAQLAKTV